MGPGRGNEAHDLRLLIVDSQGRQVRRDETHQLVEGPGHPIFKSTGLT